MTIDNVGTFLQVKDIEGHCMVIRLTHRVLWNGEPAKILEIARKPEGSFECYIGDPEHGGLHISGDNLLMLLMTRLDRNVAKEYAALFNELHNRKYFETLVKSKPIFRFECV
jgi:hypothetical protein